MIGTVNPTQKKEQRFNLLKRKVSSFELFSNEQPREMIITRSRETKFGLRNEQDIKKPTISRLFYLYNNFPKIH